jgi:hypothetical protein
VDDEDGEAAFVMLFTLPGFDAWQPESEQLRKLLYLCLQIGLHRQQICSNSFVAIFSEHNEAAMLFARHCHALLGAGGVLPIDERVRRIDGTRNRVVVTVEEIGCG